MSKEGKALLCDALGIVDFQEFESFVSEDRSCIHNTPISRFCPTCDKEMKLDYIAHNLELDEQVQAIREGICSLEELEDGLRRKVYARL